MIYASRPFGPRLIILVATIAMLPTLHVNAQTKNIPCKTALEADPRLDAKLNIDTGTIKYFVLFSIMSRKAGIEIELGPTNQDINRNAPMLACRNLSIRALMDAIAASSLFRWRRTKPTTWLLTNSEWSNAFKYGGLNVYSQERYIYGADFAREMETLSEESRAKLTSREGFSFSDLPPGMQKSTEKMMETLVRQDMASGRQRVFPMEALPEARFKLQHKTNEGVNDFWMDVKAGGRTEGFAFNDYTSRMDERDRARVKASRDGLDPLYRPLQHEINHAEAKSLPLFKKRVTLKERAVSLADVLGKLSTMLRFSLLTDPVSEFKERLDVDLVDITLGEALDKLTIQFKNTEWEWRKMVFLVIRSPYNNKRHNYQHPGIGGSAARVPKVQMREP